MKIVEPEKFYEAFIKRVKSVEDKLSSSWNNYKYYTKLMLMDVLPFVANDLHLEYDKEYFSIDAVCYEKRDMEHFTAFKNDYWAENISIAIEHENDHSSVQKEINKLALFAIPLKVTITYPEPPKEAEKVLQMAQEIINRGDILKIHGCNTNDIKFMLIFGYKGGQSIDWEGHLFCNEDGIGHWKSVGRED